jgi:hypothetical protein
MKKGLITKEEAQLAFRKMRKARDWNNNKISVLASSIFFSENNDE